MSRSSRWGRRGRDPNWGAMGPIHHEVCRALMNRFGTAPSKEPAWYYEPTLPGSAQRELPWSTFLAKKKVHRKHLAIERVPVGEADCRVQKGDSCVQFLRYQLRHPGAPSWHGGSMAANRRAFHLGKLLQTVSLKKLSTHAGRGWANLYDNRTKMDKCYSPSAPCTSFPHRPPVFSARDRVFVCRAVDGHMDGLRIPALIPH